MATGEKKIPDLQQISSVTDGVNLPVDNNIQTYRATAAQFFTYIYGKLFAVTTTALATGDYFNFFDVSASNAPKKATIADILGLVTAPTVQKFTSGSGTYTTPAGVKRLRVRMVGGGAGGSGAGTSGGGGGTAGGDTTFGSNTASGAGAVGFTAFPNDGGPGGAISVGTGTSLASFAGEKGGTSQSGTGPSGGHGGNSPFMGRGIGGFSGTDPGKSATANTGSGGGGGGSSAGAPTGRGGGAGGYIEVIINSPSGTYSYGVGAGGSGGSGGSSGLGGGDGAAGIIIVEEYYI